MSGAPIDIASSKEGALWLSMSAEEVGLAEAIASLRQELRQALAEGKGKEVQFKLGPRF